MIVATNRNVLARERFDAVHAAGDAATQSAATERGLVQLVKDDLAWQMNNHQRLLGFGLRGSSAPLRDCRLIAP